MIRIALAIAFVLTACTVTTSVGTPTEVVGPVIEKPTAKPAHPDEIHQTTQTFYVWWQTNATAGEKITGTLVAVDIGSAAPAGKEVITAEFPVPAGGNMASGNFTFEKADGWPMGSYRIDVKRGAVMLGSIPFAIHEH